MFRLLKERNNEGDFMYLVGENMNIPLEEQINKIEKSHFSNFGVSRHGISDFYLLMSCEQRNVSLKRGLGFSEFNDGVFTSREIGRDLRNTNVSVVECDLMLRDKDFVILARNYKKFMDYKQIEGYKFFKDGVGLKIKDVPVPYYFLFEDVYKNRVKFMCLFDLLIKKNT